MTRITSYNVCYTKLSRDIASREQGGKYKSGVRTPAVGTELAAHNVLSQSENPQRAVTVLEESRAMIGNGDILYGEDLPIAFLETVQLESSYNFV